MLVSRTITLELEDMLKIEEKIENGEIKSVSHFIQKAVKKEFKR